MKNEILNNLGDPKELERLYRSSKTNFKKAFLSVYPDIPENPLAQGWYERLNFEQEDISWGSRTEITLVLILCIVAGLIAKIPHFTGIKEDLFYPRNLGFIVFPALSAYFAWKTRIQGKQLFVIIAAFILPAVYINVLPQDLKSDTLVLACLHLPVFLWICTGFSFTGGRIENNDSRLHFLQYNGDLVVMGVVILISGAILSAVTVGLFRLIGLNIEKEYFQWVGIWGLSAAPIVGTYLVRSNPQLVNKVSPIIARIFTPIVLVMLVVYLGAVIYTGKDPYKDRDFLLLFNGLLVGVLAIILFSVAETSKKEESRPGILLLFLLSAVTIIVNGIALSAIVFRISEWGFTPNRLAVLGSNCLILANLILVAFRLYRALRHPEKIPNVGRSISFFIPIYGIWAIFVVVVFPVLFNFR